MILPFVKQEIFYFLCVSKINHSSSNIDFLRIKDGYVNTSPHPRAIKNWFYKKFWRGLIDSSWLHPSRADWTPFDFKKLLSSSLQILGVIDAKTVVYQFV